MIGLVNLIAIGLAVVCIILVIGSRDRMRTLEFRLALIERRLREGQTPAAAPPAAERPAEPDHLAVPEPSLPRATDEPSAPAPQSQPQTEPVASVPETVAAMPGSSLPGPSLEERFGTQWVVWAGGIAVVFGGFFLLRYSIEQGWFRPGIRVFLGALLALSLVAAGEWARRKEFLTGITGIASAHIPSILTAAGTTIAYADIWAAYELYKFLSPVAAFV